MAYIIVTLLGLLTLGIQVFVAMWIHTDAKSRNMRTEGWVLLHLFFPLVGLVIYLLARRVSSEQQIRCPICNKSLLSSWRHCPYCSSTIVIQNKESDEPETTEHLIGTTVTLRAETAYPFAKLVVLEGNRKRKEYSLNSGTTTLGREPTNNIVFDDQGISLKHAKIRLEGNRFILYDLISKNGTFVNDIQIQRHELQDGDILQMGNTKLIFICRHTPA
jgi:DNA-directed RNA polymerase subunit RPC12/RpoP